MSIPLKLFLVLEGNGNAFPETSPYFLLTLHNPISKSTAFAWRVFIEQGMKTMKIKIVNGL